MIYKTLLVLVILSLSGCATHSSDLMDNVIGELDRETAK